MGFLTLRASGRRTGALSLTGLLAAAALVSAGCSSAGAEQAVFRVATGFSNGATARTTDLVDFSPPDLYNTSGQAVRLRGLSLVAEPRSVHLRRVTAYLVSQVQIDGIGYALGDFIKHCRRQMTPYPVSAVVVPPHSSAKWFLVLLLTFAKPGRYYLRRVRIDYTSGGRNGWQYQNLYQTEIITLRNPKLHAFSGCL